MRVPTAKFNEILSNTVRIREEGKMTVNARLCIALVAASLGLVLLTGSGSIAHAVKPVPPEESNECKKARSDYYRFKAEYDKLRAKQKVVREQGKKYQAWYNKNCKRKGPKPKKCQDVHSEYLRYKAEYDRLKPQSQRIKEQALNAKDWYALNCKRAPDERESVKAGEWVCRSGMGRNIFCEKNNCYPEECYWENLATGEKREEHRPAPAGGWKP